MFGKMKKFKKVVATMLAIVSMSACLALPAEAAYSYHSKYSFSTGALWWKENYTAKVYRDSSYFRVWYGNSSVSSGFEYKNNTNIVLSQTRSFQLGSQTKASLNAGVDFSDFGVPATVGGSIEQTVSQTWGTSNTSQRTIEKTAPKGYYSYNVCMNLYKIKVEKYKGSSYKGKIEFYAPRSQAYRAIVYNRNNASYSNLSIY